MESTVVVYSSTSSLVSTMFTVQKVRQKNEVVTKSTISQDQSQKLVQTMITMCFGCLAFLRGLFPDDSFVDQKFVPEKCTKDYDKVSASSIRIKTLVREKSEEADLFLDWLENGVFQSLKEGYLKAISLGIFVDESNPNDLIETYLFAFDYSNDTISININGEKDKISLLDSRKMVQQLMRRFIIITQSLDPLPEKRFLTMRLMFNDVAPREYQPQLFRDATRDPKTVITVPHENGLDMFSVGSLNTSVHKVGLKVLSLADSTIQEKLASGITTQLDPFDLLGENIELPLDTPFNSQINAPSQTTAMLQNYLKSSPVKVQPTQAMTEDRNGVEGGRRADNTFSSKLKYIKCSQCRKMVPAVCYGNHAGSSIASCVQCLIDGKVPMDSPTMERFMMTRKIYRYMAKKPDFPKSVSEFYNIFYGDSAGDDEKRIVDEALSVLLIDEVFIVEPDVRISSSGTQLRSSGYIYVDSDSIFSAGGSLPKGMNAWTFVLRAPRARQFYTEPHAKTQVQLFKMLEECELTFRNVKKSSIESPLTLQELSINDTTNSLNYHKNANKRSRSNDKGYESQENSRLDTQTCHVDKVRKISVSKKTLKSAW